MCMKCDDCLVLWPMAAMGVFRCALLLMVQISFEFDVVVVKGAPRTAAPVCHTTSPSTSVISLSLASFSITTVSIGFCDFNLSFARIQPTTADEADELYSDEVGVTETVDCGGLTNRCRRSSIDGGANFDQKAGASR
ncbi:hypothetical protein KSS87_011020 [Heliosperma pusillum]|nr:hypothetical protein KSS87_011020 [Heliosperma pusillum]